MYTMLHNSSQRHHLLRSARWFSSGIYKPKVVIVGCGWGGYRLAKDIDKTKYEVTVISPRNHFLFTPLLPSTAVGTLEFRCIQEPVRIIPKLQYNQAVCKHVDYAKKTLICEESYRHKAFEVNYDYLVLATGSDSNTFGVSGVENNPHVFFLKQLEHARAIRNKLIELFERASIPSVDLVEKKRLLTIVIVGGGPTNIEFASELHDFLKFDVARSYADLIPLVRVIVVEATGHILGTFDSSLVSYVEKLFRTRNIEMLIHNSIQKIDNCNATFADGKQLPFGMMVWSTGVKQVDFIQNMPDEVAKLPKGRLATDGQLRVLKAIGNKKAEPLANGSVYAFVACASEVGNPLPPLAQVASQQGQYLSKVMNDHSRYFADLAVNANCGTKANIPDFQYRHLGSMANVGEWKSVIDTTNIDEPLSIPPMKGILAFLLWRAAYWTKQVSLSNKLLIPLYWFKAAIFGRDISRF